MHIELRSLRKVYAGKRALDGVSLILQPGNISALLGENGSGKTTLLRCLAGVATPTSGEIYYDERPFRRDDMELRRKLFFMPDFPYVLWEMTILQHIGMCLKVFERKRPGVEELTLQLLRDFDLLPMADRMLSTLSRGQLYKAALCALIAVGPELWLLDEPFASGMDPHGIAMFKRYSREAAAAGATIIYSTQIVDVVERFSDFACVLHEGEVKGVGAVSDLLAQSSAEPELQRVLGTLRDKA